MIHVTQSAARAEGKPTEEQNTDTYKMAHTLFTDFKAQKINNRNVPATDTRFIDSDSHSQ